MAFIDKINTLAKNVGEKTGDAIEITKLNAKISSEKSAINELYRQIGERAYKKYQACAYQDDELGGLFSSVDACVSNIAEAEGKINAIKAANEARTQASQNDPVVQAEPVRAVCPGCGMPVAEGAKFCNQCGARLEVPAIEAEKKNICSNCGAETESGARFCCCCGAKIE